MKFSLWLVLSVACCQAFTFKLVSNWNGLCVEEDGKGLKMKVCDPKKDKQRAYHSKTKGRIQFSDDECMRLQKKMGRCKKSPRIIQKGPLNARTLRVGNKCFTARAKSPFWKVCDGTLSQSWVISIVKLGSSHVFDNKAFRSYNLEISQNNINTLVADPVAETYVPCSFVTDYGTELETRHTGAGCRYKGAIGSLRMCVDPNTKRENGECRKLSLKVDTNKFRTDGHEANGIGKYLFNGMPVDMSLMAERVVYTLFNEADIPASRAVHVKIHVNGKFNGIYTLVENIDNDFTKKHFGDDDNKGKGALYKDAWINSISSLQYFKEYRESDDKDEDRFMMQVTNALAATPETPASAMLALEKYFDVNSLINVIAMNTIVGATDDWRIRHNFFFYVMEDTDKDTNTTEKKIVLLPWDYDRINDSRAEERLAGTPWHETPSPWSPEAQSCNAPLIDPAQKAFETVMGDMSKFEHMKMIWSMLPKDMSRKIQCDKITKLMAVALKKHVYARAMELMADKASLEEIKKHMGDIGNMITDAQLASEDAPHTVGEWNKAIQELYDYLAKNQRSTRATAASMGITAENYESHLYGFEPEEEEVAEVRQNAAVGQFSDDRVVTPTPAPVSFNNAPATFGQPATPWGQTSPFQSAFQSPFGGFQQNVMGGFGGFASFRG